jgi:glycosyltransferase involved in cell wall biosynthesis
MKKLKVIHVINTLGIGGAEKVVSSLAIGMKDRCDISVIVISKKFNSLNRKNLTQNNINIYYLNAKNFFNLKVHIKIYQILKSLQPDVIHTHLGGLSYIFLVAKIMKIKTLIHTIHSPRECDDKRINFFHRFAFKFGVTPVTVSNNIKKQMQKKIGRFDFCTIYNGIETKRTKIKLTKEKKYIPKNNFVFINVANLYQVKNHQILIESFSRITKIKKNYFLLIIGGGALKNEIKNQIDRLNIRKYCKIISDCQNPEKYLRISDCFVLTSKSEGLPISILEAMRERVPVIATNVGGIPEIITDKKNGFLIPSNNVKELTKLMEKISKMSKADRQEISRNGYQTLREKFSLRNMIESYYKLYTK